MVGQRLRSTLVKEVCPYCFETFRLSGAPFRCSSPPTVCAPEPDKIMDDKWQDSRPMGRVLPPANLFRRSARCSECGHTTDDRLCPHCHMELPATTGECRNLIFSVIGAKEAGKSHFIAVLIEQLLQHLGPSLDLLLQPLNEHTIRRYRQEFYGPIYKNKTTIEATRSGLESAAGVRHPLLYGLTISGSGLFGGSRIKRAVTLVFFDTAGEDLKSFETMKAVNRYIYRSDGIILLLDPLQLPQVRDRLSGSTPLPGANTETEDIVTRVSELIRRGRGLKRNARIRTPLALAFSKLDAVQTLIDDHYQINARPNHDGGFDVDDFEAVSSEIETLIADWRGQALLHQVRTHYVTFGFFGVSSLGCNPHGDNKVPYVIPQRIGDPFLWLLHRHGLLPRARRERRAG